MKNHKLIIDFMSAACLCLILPAFLLENYLESGPGWLLPLEVYLLCSCLYLLLHLVRKKAGNGLSIDYFRILLVEFIVSLYIASKNLSAEFVGLSVTFGLLVVLLVNHTRNLWWRLVTALMWCGCLVLLGWWKKYEEFYGPPAFDTYLTVFETNFYEAKSYFLQNLNYDSLVLCSAYFLWSMAVYILFRFVKDQSRISDSFRRMTSLSLFALIFTSVFLYAGPLNARVDIFRDSLENFRVAMERQKTLAGSFGNNPLATRNFAFEGNFIFILGESTTRRHMRLYGYSRETTPFLSTNRDKLLVSYDTLATHSHTALTVPDIFNVNFLSVPYAGDNHDYPDMIAALKSGGFHTWWISNQSEYGLCDDIVALIGKRADDYVFIRKTFDKYDRVKPYDSELLPYIDRALQTDSRKKAIFVHLYATHLPYCEGIPQEARNILKQTNGLGEKYFGGYSGDVSEVNCYDNGVRYVDSVLGSIVALAEKQERPTVVVYLSDHGDHPANKTYHNSSKPSAYHLEVPHLWFLNEAARKINQDKVLNFAGNSSQPFSTRDLCHSVMDILGAEKSDFDKAKSLFAKEYAARPRLSLYNGKTFMEYDNAYSIDRKDYLEITRNQLGLMAKADSEAYGRVWAHRVDSLGKLLEAKEYFAGVEADVVFDEREKEFFVYHPPAANTGLSLQEYLEASQDRPFLKIWLDWKNPSADNVNQAVARLSALDAAYHLKSRLLLETAAEANFPGLRRIAKAGFAHSYYVPTEMLQQCSRDPGATACDEFSRVLEKRLGDTGADSVSYDILGEPFFTYYRDRFSPYRQLTWNLSLSSTTENLIHALGDIHRYKGYLIVFNSIYGI